MDNLECNMYYTLLGFFVCIYSIVSYCTLVDNIFEKGHFSVVVYWKELSLSYIH